MTLPNWRYSVFIQDENPRSNVANITKRDKRATLPGSIRPTFCPDLAPPEDQLFWLLSYNLMGVSFINDVKLKMLLNYFLS